MAIEFNTSRKIAYPSGFFNHDRTQPFSMAAHIYSTGLKSGVQQDYAIFSKMLGGAPWTGIEFGLMWLSPKLTLNLYMINNHPSNSINVFGTTDLPLNTWFHAAVTYDGSSNVSGVKLYVNGTVETNDVKANALTGSLLNASLFHAGSRNGTLVWQKGSMQSMGVWSAALTADECKSLSVGFSPANVRPQSLISHLPLVRDIYDTKGNALTPTGTTVSSLSQRIYA